jgi:hypothetical protein
MMDWENRGAGDLAFERSLTLLGQQGDRIGAVVACGETRSMGVISKTAGRLTFAGRPSYRDSCCDVYFPRDRRPARELTLP